VRIFHGIFALLEAVIGSLLDLSYCTYLNLRYSQNSTADTSQLEESQTEEPVKKKKKKEKKEVDEDEVPLENGHNHR
jgi:hypothetical protein